MSSHNSKPIRYGWYSATAAHARAYANNKVFYNTPSGEKVEVTSVTESSTDSSTLWPDIECIGEVTNYWGPRKS